MDWTNPRAVGDRVYHSSIKKFNHLLLNDFMNFGFRVFDFAPMVYNRLPSKIFMRYKYEGRRIPLLSVPSSKSRVPVLESILVKSSESRVNGFGLGITGRWDLSSIRIVLSMDMDNGENIMKSIKEGPFQMGTVSDVITGGTEGAVQQGPVRARVLNDLSAEEKERASSNERKQSYVSGGKSCGFKDVVVRYQLRIIKEDIFSRNNTRGNGVAGNVGGQNRGGLSILVTSRDNGGDSPRIDLALNVETMHLK
ncbi:hypothetical protein Tco_0790534 [Tanacetum coccineum]